ncbi:hypothetical protein OPQ81_002519 [Rhizoctonia solani]|nr:hypothetical protein OPQ81_002519 [Rhizoctonia solani]
MKQWSDTRSNLPVVFGHRDGSGVPSQTLMPLLRECSRMIKKYSMKPLHWSYGQGLYVQTSMNQGWGIQP